MARHWKSRQAGHTTPVFPRGLDRGAWAADPRSDEDAGFRHRCRAAKLGTMERMRDTVTRLLDWFARNARKLPWRVEPRDPYRVLVSELMLQQTQVDRVVPRFEQFVGRFPNLHALAGASEDEVLEEWSGLGYYRRARMLHRLALLVTSESAELPRAAAQLQRLPGVGPYTAAAVASLAHGEAVPVLDGNVVRVACRVLAFSGDPRGSVGRQQLTRWAHRLVAVGPPGRVNEALMELGATVCLPSNPACASCPLANECRAFDQGRTHAFPRPRPRRPPVRLRWVAACCIDGNGRWLARRITEGPILRGLWLPPIGELVDGKDPVDAARMLIPFEPEGRPELLPVVEHSITHRRILVTPIRWTVDQGTGCPAGDRWVMPGAEGVGTSSLFGKLIRVSDLCGTTGNE